LIQCLSKIKNYVADGFGYVQPHAPRMIIETPTGQDGCCDEGDPRIKKKLVNYDANGNQLEITEVIGEDEIIVLKNLWDEENRLRAVDLNPDNDEHHNIAVYTYDASGQRILRHIPTRVDVYSNAVTSGQEERDVTMIYPSGLITAKVLNPESWGRDDEPGPGGSLIEPILRYTKHYYIGTERISSATDTRSNVGYFIENTNYNNFFDVSTLRAMSNAIVEAAGDALEEAYGSFGLEYTVPAPVVEDDKPHTGETDFFAPQVGWYFFHPDHLGSSSYITNLAGVISQHMEYLPFGELLVEEHLNSHNSPFKFNTKELDEETGNYYYGARYYDPKWSIFISVDPLTLSYPNWSPYAYTYHNPVRWTDSTGMCPDGDCPEFANDGDMHTASDGNTYMHQFGRWSDGAVVDLGTVSSNRGGERESGFTGKFINLTALIYGGTRLTIEGKEGSGYWESNPLRSDFFGGWGFGDYAGGDLNIYINPCYMDTNSLVDILNSATLIESYSWGVFGVLNEATFTGMDDDGNVIYRMTNNVDDKGWNNGGLPTQTSEAPTWGNSRNQIPMSERDSIRQAKANIEAGKGNVSKYEEFYLRKKGQ
jgi:RHS repeat-associated protein